MKDKFCINTVKGNLFDPETGKISEVDIADIAHALSHMCRYAGHCSSFYSVAEHSVLVCDIVRAFWPDDLEAQWAGLLHDATEAYVCDIPTQLKLTLPKFQMLESKVNDQIAKAYNVTWNERVRERVKSADLIALSTESRKLFGDVSSWKMIHNHTPMPELLSPSFPSGDFVAVKHVFLARFTELLAEIEKGTK